MSVCKLTGAGIFRVCVSFHHSHFLSKTTGPILHPFRGQSGYGQFDSDCPTTGQQTNIRLDTMFLFMKAVMFMHHDNLILQSQIYQVYQMCRYSCTVRWNLHDMNGFICVSWSEGPYEVVFDGPASDNDTGRLQSHNH